MSNSDVIGTIMSDGETPSFETVRIKLKVGKHVQPGMLLRMETNRDGGGVLIGRVRSAYEHNPNENPLDINVRDGLSLAPNYPKEHESTIIYRVAEADLIEEIVKERVDQTTEISLRSPQTLPNAGAEVTRASDEEVVKTLGLEQRDELALLIGHTIGGPEVPMKLSRSSIQRHFFDTSPKNWTREMLVFPAL